MVTFHIRPSRMWKRLQVVVAFPGALRRMVVVD
jgi:hypothetical protein